MARNWRSLVLMERYASSTWNRAARWATWRGTAAWAGHWRTRPTASCLPPAARTSGCSCGTLRPEEKSSVLILADMRKDYHERSNKLKFGYQIFTLILTLDLIVIVGLKFQTMNIIGWMGLATLICAMLAFYYSYHNHNKMITVIDNFYLSVMNDIEERNEIRERRRNRIKG